MLKPNIIWYFVLVKKLFLDNVLTKIANKKYTVYKVKLFFSMDLQIFSSFIILCIFSILNYDYRIFKLIFIDRRKIKR